ncbi:hypothetical protein LCGC14_0618950 [marine sediment metagenome]|uniref:Uncharacterized protein n=1 Tax=marine sediment metagenome TaxID=412755 RepID=A0A0F9R5G6_9ZZZZ
MPRKTPSQIKNILKEYDELKASGNESPQIQIATKHKIARQTLSKWVKNRDNPSKEAPKDNTNITIREIIANKELDKQFNEGEGGRIQNIPSENVAKHLFEKYPKRAKELLDKNYEWALDLTFKELEVGIPSKDIEALREGYSLSDILNDNRSPHTEIEKLTKDAETIKKRAELTKAQREIMKAKNDMYDMETDKYGMEIAQYIAKDGAERIKGTEQSVQYNAEELENLYFNNEFEEMWSEMSNLSLESAIPHNPAVFNFKKRHFLLKWAYRLARANEIKQLKAERKRDNEEMEQGLLERRLTRLPTEALEVLELVYDKKWNGDIDANRF